MKNMNSKTIGDIMILKNAAQCRGCGTYLESKHRHDFQGCFCYKRSEGKTGIFIDGGKDYRRMGGDSEVFIDLSEVENE